MKRLLIIIIGLVTTLLAFLNSTNNREWQSFPYPVFELTYEDKSSDGAQLFNELIENPDSLFRSCILQVCQTLYRKQSEVPEKKIFLFNLRASSGVAATGGDSTTIDMFLSTDYIISFHINNNKDKERTLSEIIGIIIHELVHAYQHSPSGAGGYALGTEHFSFVEGMADATRLDAGFISPEFRKPGGHWNDGYKTTGFFIGWLKTLDKDFLYHFNQSALTIKPWTWDKAVKQILNKPVSDLWCEYQKFINPHGEIPVADFRSKKGQMLFTDTWIQFEDISSGHPYQWNWFFEGANPSYSRIKTPEVIYKEPGIYTAKLAIKGPFGEDSMIREGSIIIERNPAGNLFSNYEKTITAQYNDSPPAENASKLFDNNRYSKYLTFNSSGWVQIKLEKQYKINKYCIVSANDSPERDPRRIVVKGSNDETNWVIIDVRDNIDFKTRYQTLEFSVKNQNPFSCFRFELTNHEGNILQIADILLYGDSADI